MALPLFQTQIRELSLLQTKWKGELDPKLANPISNGIFLNSIALISGDNTINHLLSRNLQGYIITSMSGAFAQIYSVPSQMPDKTLILNANGPTTVTLYVF